MCIENTLIDISIESKGLNKAERLSLKLIAKDVKELKEEIAGWMKWKKGIDKLLDERLALKLKVKKLKTKIKQLEEILRLFRQDEPTAEEENLKNTKPCPYNKEVMCVQYPEESCGCDPCEECETKLKADQALGKKGE